MKSFLRLSFSTFAVLALGFAISGAQSVFAQSTIIISEFRFRAGSGGNDEFIEFYNNSDAPITVVDATPDASATTPDGWALVGVNLGTGSTSTRFVIPNGTVIPARGHFLAVNIGASGYSLGGYATGDQVANPSTGALSSGYTTGIVDNGGIALFSTANPANLPPTNTANPNPFRLDAVGFTGGTQPLFVEGAGLSPAGGITASPASFSFVRRLSTGTPQDTNDNQNDFDLVSTTAATLNGRASILGAPGPENLSSPVQRNATIKASLIEPATPLSAPPNRVRDPEDITSDNQDLGTLKIRRRFTNTTGETVTRLRFRVVNITTLNSPVVATPQADLRLLSSTTEAVTPTSIGVSSVNGTTLESTSDPINGGLNASVTIIPPNGSLAPGTTIDLQFTLGVEANGAFSFFVNVEALTEPAPAATSKPQRQRKLSSARQLRSTDR
ncbi:MAG: lamin tail domain-containing protein [Pyrinomonadaceae bacterium]